MKPTASHLARLNLLAATQNDNEATKRQKLESGYLRKVAHLKHQTSLLHKSSQKGGLSSPGAKALHHSKLCVTVPREPRLETHRRAQWRRFKSKYDLTSSDHITSQKQISSKVRSSKKKIFGSHSTPESKIRTQKSPISQEYKSSNEKKLLLHPPIELFSKLTLKCEMNSDEESQPKQHH
ncbi:unnamed protein product [Cuscuta epithymum]|uniref:Uncharacterized protein n=1 Tax=Cuscuta epithymum TaxID=186058 RepID=A0AAV0EFQ7_9ASTE|nr:unnamed protein product [Cuscuta epithymum]